jgi:tetratricopeptide (TPR) repeat protein
MTADEAFARTRMSVSRITNTERVPWVSSSLNTEFHFSIPKEKSSPVQDPSVQPLGKDAVTSREDKQQPFVGSLAAPGTVQPSIVGAAPAATAARQPERLPQSNQLEAASPRRPSEAEVQRKLELDTEIAHNPNDEIAYYKRGQLFAQQREIAAAIIDFTRSIELNPENPEGFNNRCWVRTLSGDLKNAIADCNEALRLRPGFADALDSRGLANLKAGSFDAAISDYNAVLGIDPGHISALYGRGIAKQRLGQKREGDEDVMSALSKNPNLESEFATYGLR